VALPFPGPLARFGEVGAARAGTERVGAACASLIYVRRLRAELERFAPDIVHAHGIKMQVLSRWALPRRSRLVWHLHDYVAGRGASGRALRASSGRCAAVIANSRSVADDFRERVNGASPISVIYNAIDIGKFAPEGHRLDLDALAGMPPAAPGTVRIGLPATFGRWKGHDVFLRALGRLSGIAPGTTWRGYIIGDAVYQTRGSQWSRDDLQSMAAGLGIGTEIGFTGLVEDMPSALRALDIVVHASTQPEPFGMSIAEAMSCGRATIVALAGGVAEIVRDTVDAVGYAPSDDDSLSRKLAALAGDPALRARLGLEGRRRASILFDSRRLGPELERVYEPILALT
jgi:glycosyltransferase involved in cell wall biosynthesis